MNAPARIKTALEHLIAEARAAGSGELGAEVLPEATRTLIDVATSEIVVSIRELVREELLANASGDRIVTTDRLRDQPRDD